MTGASLGSTPTIIRSPGEAQPRSWTWPQPARRKEPKYLSQPPSFSQALNALPGTTGCAGSVLGCGSFFWASVGPPVHCPVNSVNCVHSGCRQNSVNCVQSEGRQNSVNFVHSGCRQSQPHHPKSHSVCSDSPGCPTKSQKPFPRTPLPENPDCQGLVGHRRTRYRGVRERPLGRWRK